MRALVLAGGLGTRLKQVLPDLPKPMAPVAGRPFLEHVLDRLIRGGVRQIILSLGHRAEVIRSHFGTRYRDAELRCVVEAAPLGTGGAIVHALRGEPDVPFIVLNGDTLLDADFQALVEWYRAEPEPLAMVVRNVSDASRYGTVLVSEGRVTRFSVRGPSTTGLVNAGVYVLRSAVFRDRTLPEVFSFEADFLERHCETLRPRVWLCDSYFIDIGVPEDLARAQRELRTMHGA
jgi:D-glycero-alpha-D-manno-heptose 1-phosphate guanylyltransferase